MNESLGLRTGTRSNALPQAVRAPGLPQQHLLGSGPELSEQVVMLIKTGEPPPETATTEPTQITPHYWRSLTYDIYTGQGWTTSATDPLTYKAGEAARSAAGPGRRLAQQAVELIDPPAGLLYAAGELVGADPAYTVHWRSEDDALAATIDSSTYRADSLIPAVSAAELRAAGVDYPGWIRSRYLALPPELPARVQRLAHQLAAPAASPYDQAKAIEAYLRSFPYSLAVAEPPPERDVVDYFLFDLQQGYCDYYATAMVVLARAAGLPARLAVGYIGGRYQADSGRYLVSKAEAHSWPEIYFPEYGWINFEPTGGRPALERPAEAESHPSAPPLAGEASKETGNPGGLIWPALLVGVGLVLLAGLGGRAWDNWRLRRAAPAATIAMLYQRLYRHGPRLAVSPQPADTPYEFAAALNRRLTELAAASRWPEFLAAGAAEIDYLARLYVRACFSAHPPDRAGQARAIHAWRRLRQRLWLAWLYRVARGAHPR
jgi:transglutaminase-like putative cysteine protease